MGNRSSKDSGPPGVTARAGEQGVHTGGGGIHGIGQGQGTDPVINTLRTRGARFMQVEEGAANMEKEKTE